MFGVTRKYRIRNKHIKGSSRVALIKEKLRILFPIVCACTLENPNNPIQRIIILKIKVVSVTSR